VSYDTFYCLSIEPVKETAIKSKGFTLVEVLIVLAVIGILAGFPLVFVALLTGFVIGGIAAGILLAAKQKRHKDPLPLAPFLTAGLVVTMLQGEKILTMIVER